MCPRGPEKASAPITEVELRAGPTTNSTTSDRAGVTNGVYVITEDTDGGVYEPMVLPVGAQAFRFCCQFISPGNFNMLGT